MFNYGEAVATAKEHSFLIGTQISKGFRITGIIEAVVVAPLDGISQYRFLKNYKACRDAAASLQGYEGNLYTVLLIGKSLRNHNDIFSIELSRYLAENLHSA